MKRLLEKIRQMLNKRRTRRILTRVVSIVGALVVFVTTYALVLPAITMEKQAACGIEEHQHDDSCFEEQLICGEEESETHQHTAQCYERVMVCGKPSHVHSTECYQALEESAETESGITESGMGDVTEADPAAATDSTAAETGTADAAADGIDDTGTMEASDANTGAENGSGTVDAEDIDSARGGSETTGEPGETEPEVKEDAGFDPVAAPDSSAEKTGTEDAAADETDDTDTQETTDTNADTNADSKDETGRADATDSASAQDGSTGNKAADSAEKQKDDSLDSQAGAEAGKTSGAGAENSETAADAAEEKNETYAGLEGTLDLAEVLTDRTDFYYYPAQYDENGKADTESISSGSVTDWEKVKDNTEIAPEDFVRVYLAYTIPAGTLNKNHYTARYRLPGALRLTEDQIEAINKADNGVTRQMEDSRDDTDASTDAGLKDFPTDAETWRGAEAIEGTRTPDQKLNEGDTEYISATIKVENIYKDGEYQGQDLILTFAPYTVSKNQTTLAADGKTLAEGEKVKGFFALDLNPAQISCDETGISEIRFAEESDADDTASGLFAHEEILRTLHLKDRTGDATDGTDADPADKKDNGTEGKDTDTTTENQTEAAADSKADEENADGTDADAADQADASKVDKDKFLTGSVIAASGETYEVKVTYDDDAQILDGSELRVKELLEEDDGYDDYCQQAVEKVEETSVAPADSANGNDVSAVGDDASAAVNDTSDAGNDAPAGGNNTSATDGAQGQTPVKKSTGYVRVFDIEIWNNDQKIEPSAEVLVEIRLKDAPEDKKTNLDVVHFAEDGPEVLVADQNTQDTADTSLEFTTDAFSVYTIVATETISVDYLSADGETYKISVDISNATNIPAGAELKVEELSSDTAEYKEYVRQIEKTLRTEKANFTFTRLFDISIMSNGREIEPDGTVNVKIELEENAKDTVNVSTIHFTGEGPVLVKSDTEEAEGTLNEVNFQTGSFSIYAVVGEGEQGEYARMTIHFVNDDTEIAQMIIKNGDTAEELEYIIYDPGVGDLEAGELFKGWTMKEDYSADDAKTPYDAETNPNGYMNIRNIREWALAQDIEEHGEQTFYTMVFKTYSVAFLDEDGVTAHGEALIFKSNDGYTNYVIEQDYTPNNPETSNFEGWYWNSPTAGAVKTATGEPIGQDTPIPVGTTVQISGNVTFSPNPAEGYWLIFNANGRNTSYTAPQFVKNGSVTEKPSDPTRFGYTFAGWYTDEDCTQPFTFGSALSGRTELYAKWEEVETAGYTVIVWKEKSGDTYDNNAAEGKTREYDYWKSYNFVGNVGYVINAVSNSNTQTSDVNGSYYDVRVRGRTSSGTTVNEIISELGYHAAGYDTNVEITPEGTAILNVYYDRHVVTYTFHYPFGYTYTALTQTDNDNNPAKYGDVNGQKARVYWNNGAFRTSNNWNGTVYNGTVYTRGNNQSWQTYQEEIGLYGEKLNWPADTSIYWYPNGGNNGGVSGTRMTYKNDFIPLDADMSVNYYGVDGSGDQEIRFYTQDLDNPNNYTMQYSVSASNVGNFQVNDKFTGFHAYQTRSYTSNGWGDSWSNWTNVGTLNPDTGIYSEVPVNDILEIRYNRIYNTIAYMDGKYFDGNGIEQEEDNKGKFYETDQMFYETDLRSYNEGGANYYTPPTEDIPAGYVFGGWYADEECTVKYNFTTMPVTGVTVYAKWVKIQYRVFLHPNVPASDISYDIGGQSTSFRVDYNGKIADGNTIYATRNDYELVGWYLDEDCTKIYSFDAYTLRDDATTLSGESLFSDYGKTEDTELDKYGNAEAGKQGVNKDKDPNEDGDYSDERFWITKKVDLYAKWRSMIVGAPGIRVQYDAWQDDEVTGKIAYISGQPRSYMDPLTYYLDRAEATAAAASTPDDDKLQFLYWVVQRWDETAQKYVDTDINVYPGDTFEVLKANARVVDIENPSQEQIDAGVTKTYTVQVRAQYGDKEEHTPTHIVWYPNFDTEQQPKTDDNLRINEAVDIEPSTLFEREGYNFVGWAREPEYAATDTQHTTPITQYPDAAAWLIWDGSDFTVTDTGNTATQVAADERLPYHGMYAVWEPKPYTVTVEKVVEGTEEDKATDFTFNSSLSADSFTLRDTQTKEFENVNYDSTFTVSETENENFTTSYSYKIGQNGEAVTFEPGVSIIVKGDMYITVTNTRKVYSVDIAKTDKNGVALDGAFFEVLKYDGTGYRKYLDENIAVDDFANVELTPGDYELVEKIAPAGYIITTNKYHFNLSTSGTITITSTETFADGTVIVTKETAKSIGSVGTVSIKNEPGMELPHTGGPGTLLYTLSGITLMLGAALMYGFRMRRRERRLN